MGSSNNNSSSPRLGKTFGFVAVLTVLSKFAGLLRDIVVAAAYGTGPIADAYNYTYLLTGNILILFGGLGGPFHSSTVTVFSARKDDPESGRLLTQILVLTALALLAITTLIWFASPYIIDMMAASYAPKQAAQSLAATQAIFRHELTVQLIWMLPLIVIAGLVGIVYGILNVYNKVIGPSLSPAIASLAIIAAIAWCWLEGVHKLSSGLPLAIGTLVGALGQLVFQLPALAKLPLKFSLSSLKPEEGFKEYGAMLWPAIFSTSIGQLTVYVDSLFAIGLNEGAWTAIINSNRIVQLPLGVLLTAMLVPILPRFTLQASEGRLDDLRSDLHRALRALWFLSLPMMAMLLAIPQPIIKALFQRGAWNEQSTSMVVIALVFIVPSIFFYVARDIITRVFYAFKDSRTPYHVALIAIFLKALLDYLLVGPFGVGGISLATTLITIFNMTVLGILLRNHLGSLQLKQLAAPVGQMLFASLVCAIITLAANHLLSITLHSTITLLNVILSCTAGGTVYFMICALLKLRECNIVLAKLPKRKIPEDR